MVGGRDRRMIYLTLLPVTCMLENSFMREFGDKNDREREREIESARGTLKISLLGTTNLHTGIHINPRPAYNPQPPTKSCTNAGSTRQSTRSPPPKG